MKFDICVIFLKNANFLVSPVSCSNSGARPDEPSQVGRLVFNHLISLFILYLYNDGVIVFEVSLLFLRSNNMLHYKIECVIGSLNVNFQNRTLLHRVMKKL